MSENVSHATLRLTPLVLRQIEAVKSGYRRRVTHGGALCSHCLTNPPTHRPYCARCRARYAQLRRKFIGSDLKCAWAVDAREKQRQAGQPHGEARG